MSKAGLTGAGGLAGMLITGVGILDLKVAADAGPVDLLGGIACVLTPFSVFSVINQDHMFRLVTQN